jgi:3-methyladenine DNA glycosylase AlkD
VASAADLAPKLLAEIAALPKRDTPSVRDVRRRWSAKLKGAPDKEVLALAAAHEQAAGQTGKWVAYELIRFHKGALATVTEAQVEDFAGRVASWYAVDAFGTILAGPLWRAGQVTDALVDCWSVSPDRWLRRLSLVATVGLNAPHGGRGDAARTLAICRRLAGDRDDMVEKALSWALRFLSQRDRPAVEAFMDEMDEALPARVRREVRHKLATGLKSGRNRNMVTRV